MARLLQGRQGRPRGASRHLPHHRARRARHEPDGLPEGRVVEPAALQRGARPLSDEARRRARRRQVAARLLGDRLQRHRRRHPRCRAGPGPAVALPHRHTGRRRHAADPVEHVLGAARLPGHRSAGGDQRLQPRHLHHLRQVRPGARRRRLLPQRAGAHLARQPGVHQHHLVPLHAGGAVQRRRGRHHRTRLQPVRGPRRLPRADRDRHRRRVRQRHVAGGHRRGPGGLATS